MPDRPVLMPAAAIATVLVTACGSDAPATGPASPPASPTSVDTAVPGPTPDVDTVDGERLVGHLCAAADADDVGDAGRAFMNAHGPLHDLARDVVESDRQVAARLHEAKQQTEAALEGGDADDLGRNLDELIDATRASLETVGQQVGGCDDERNAP